MRQCNLSASKRTTIFPIRCQAKEQYTVRIRKSPRQESIVPTPVESIPEDMLTVRHDRAYIYHNFTNSLCPTCLKVVQAKVILQSNKVFMLTTCPEHAAIRTLLSSHHPY